MSTPVNVHQAKTHFSKLLARVQAGEEIIIAKAGRPIAKIVPIQPEKNQESQEQPKEKSGSHLILTSPCQRRS